jgi:hypothetical protein
MAALLGAALVLAACGISNAPSPSVQASGPSQSASQVPEVLAVVCQPVAKAFDPDNFDLTGPWAGDDGGIYYLRQLGSVLWWNGMSGREGSPLDLGREWNNVGRGVITGLQIEVEWSDVPRGESLNDGTLILNIQDDGTGNVEIVTVDIGDFGNFVWTPCSPAELLVADYLRTYGGEAFRYAEILTLEACDDLAELDRSVTDALNTAEAGSPEFEAALGYSRAISERELALGC